MKEIIFFLPKIAIKRQLNLRIPKVYFQFCEIFPHLLQSLQKAPENYINRFKTTRSLGIISNHFLI